MISNISTLDEFTDFVTSTSQIGFTSVVLFALLFDMSVSGVVELTVTTFVITPSFKTWVIKTKVSEDESVKSPTFQTPFE